MMSVIRPPAVAGTFYPGDPVRLREQLDELIEGAVASRDPGVPVATSPKAVIAPHAGYIYSGPIAANAFRPLEPLRGRVRRVVLIGPSHFVPFTGIALPGADAFETPLGQVALDADGVAHAEQFPQVVTLPQAHGREHGIEVELPFIQSVLGEVGIVPMVTGSATAEQVGEVIDALWGGDETLIVISSDLSHFYDYDTARRLDDATARAIVEMRPEDLGEGSACGRLAIQGLLWAAERRDTGVALLDLRNSGDTAGPRNEVVGYGAFAVS
jgi:AmmeMemoRadiSam system protein B